MPDLELSQLQRAIIERLEDRGIRGTWVATGGRHRLALKMLLSMAPSSVYLTFANPAALEDFQVIGWRSGTMEELKIARPVIWELCTLTQSPQLLGFYREFWKLTSPMDWDGNPGVDYSPPLAIPA